MLSKGNIHTSQKSAGGEHEAFKERGWLLRDMGTGFASRRWVVGSVQEAGVE